MIDWSVLYFSIVVALLASVLLALIYSLVRFCRKGVLPCKDLCSKKQRRKLHRYSPLADPESIRMSTQSRMAINPSANQRLIRHDDVLTEFNSLVPSDLDSDTDSEVMFDSSKNNGANGKIVRPAAPDHINAWIKILLEQPYCKFVIKHNICFCFDWFHFIFLSFSFPLCATVCATVCNHVKFNDAD